MKRKIISFLTAAAIAVSVIPAISFAADNEVQPVLRYTFDNSNELAGEDGKNELKLFGGANVTDEGNVGKGLLLDGTDGYALLPSGILSDTMTISSWVKINKFTTWGRVFDFGTDDSSNFFFCPYSGSASRTELKSPSGSDTMDALQESERDWVHYAVTFDKDTVSYYRNGKLIKSKSNMRVKPSDIKDALNYIGKSHYEGDAYLSAVIDDFRVYDKALTDNDILNVMADGYISHSILLDSYAIEDNQIVTGDSMQLPGFSVGNAMSQKRYDVLWSHDGSSGDIIKSIEQNGDGYIVTFNKPEQTTAVTLTEMAFIGDVGEPRYYTIYVTGTKESPFKVTIDTSDRSKDVSDNMWGLFFEDINSAADGGLYAEMVQNRSFETEKDGHLYSWKTEGDVKINTENPLNENNPTYVTLGEGASITNDGFMGMSTKKDETYNFSMYARLSGDAYPQVILADEDGKIGAELSYSTPVESGGGEWKKISGTIIAMNDTDNAKLTVINNGDTSVDVDMISLIPEDTYKGHGLRKDFMEALEAMHPKFLRFPGGCAIEGNTMETAWNWKDTVGDVSERKEMVNIWSPSDKTYMMTYGLGFYEYFQMCEDLGMEPVPILNCGMACQARSGGKTDEDYLVPMDKLQPYIDDALDLIEFANGTDESNKWVKLRADMGHSEPFNLHYIGIGNEQFGDIYFERYYEFAKQIHEKYPEMNLVTTSGLSSSGTSNDLAWNWINEHTELADRVDEHYYENPDWFRTHAYRYDNYRRDTNSKVFLGEYASKGNTWYNALSEAAFMTGLERNADVVRMASYAPMFAKYGNTQWSAANMIWFNNDDMVLTPNYYVQSLFANNKGNYSLPTDVKMNGIETDDTFHGGVVLGSWGTQNEFKDVTVGDTAVEFNDNWIEGVGEWAVNDGVLVQSSDATGSTYFNDTETANSTLNVKVRKTGGGEGFQIGVAAEDNLNYYRVNIGGWGNTTAKIQHIVDGVSAEVGNVAEQSYVSDVHIEDNKWYDVRVEVSDYEIKAYLDDEFICSYQKPKKYGPVYASSVYDEKTHEVIIKLVNTLGYEVPIDVRSKGTGVNGGEIITGLDFAGSAEATIMSGDTSLENTLEKTNIVPYKKDIFTANRASSFVYNAPANSLSVIRASVTPPAHHPYMYGYEDGTFRPDNSITRAEAAAIISRADLLDTISKTDEREEFSGRDDFSDVPSDAWYKTNVNYCSEKGLISGYEDGTFKPENNITRAEFMTILCNYMGYEKDNDIDYPDTVSHWAKGYIGALVNRKFVEGFPDGSMKPDSPVTRAEAAAMLNRLSGIAESSTKSIGNHFTDVEKEHWAYNDILIATTYDYHNEFSDYDN